MPRRWRVDGLICHVYNRAAAKLPLFENARDYGLFLEILRATKSDFSESIRLFGYCVMPNHWHFIICPQTTEALSQFMRCLTRGHALAFLANHPSRSGAVYQGRFRSVPVQDGEYLRTLLLYVDRNPLKARLVSRAEHWLWSSAIGHAGIENDPLLDPLPAGILTDWVWRMNQLGPPDSILEAALRRNAPVGESEWIASLSREWADARGRGRRPLTNRENSTGKKLQLSL